MDQDNSLQISFDEWRSFFMINPVILESVTNDPHEMLKYWRNARLVILCYSYKNHYLLID
jgi:hypothetical protein